jgi:hypothetical protein
MLRSIFIVTAMLSCWSWTASAAESWQPWDVQSVQLERLPDDGVVNPLDAVSDCSGMKTNSLEDGNIGWSDIIAIGQQVWKIVEANKPVVTTNTPVVHALPRGLNCWAELDQWQAPKTESYQVVYKNGFGMEVVKFRFRLQYTYGGGKHGVGKYLANVTVMPAELNVIWGYTFNADVQVGQTVNLGTHEDPVAGIQMDVKWQVKTVLKESDNSFHFFVQGDGISKSAE